MLPNKKIAELLPEDLDDVRDNPIAYGLPEEAGTWADDQIISAMQEFLDPEMVAASKKLAKSPPGWSKTVERMKKHKDIDNPFALAWYEYNKGYKPSASKKTADYQGWKNYETWNVALWIDNDQGLQEQVIAWARGEDGVKDDYELANRIKGLVDELNPLADQASMYTDLLNGAISEVNFRDIASHFLDMTKEGSKKVAIHPAGEKIMEGAVEPEVTPFDEDGIRKEMAVALESTPEDISVDSWGKNAYRVKDGTIEYTVVENEDDAEAMALAQVKEDLEQDPELFNKDWLEGLIDREALAEETAEEDWTNYAEIDEEKSGKELNAETETEDYDEDETYHHSAAWDEWKTEEQWKTQYKDGILDEFETYFPKDTWINHIDIDSAAADAVSTDGWPHFLSHYDGKYDTTASGFVYWRD